MPEETGAPPKASAKPKETKKEQTKQSSGKPTPRT